MRRFTFLSLLLLLGFTGYSQSSLNDLDIHFQHDFNADATGQYQTEQWSDDWLTPPWVNRQEALQIVEDFSDNVNPTKSLYIDFPANSLGPDQGGTNWPTSIPNPCEELYVSYDIMFMPGFVFQAGGKLPSAKGGEVDGTTRPTGYDGFCAYLMFKGDRPAFYTYYPDNNMPQYGSLWEWGQSYTSADFSPSKVQFDYASGLVHFVPGTWHNLTYRLVLNTVNSYGGGNYDGILEAFFDGKLVSQISHILFRQTADLKIDAMQMMTFFGGSTDDYRNPIYEYIKIDNVLLYTFKDGIDVPRGNTLSPTNRTINYWRSFNTPVASEPAAPVSLIELDQTATSITLGWQDRSYNEKGFKIYRSTSENGSYTNIATTTANVTKYTDGSLTTGVTYYYKVLAYNDVGNSAETSVLAATTLQDDSPSAPSSLTASLASSNSVKLTWKDNSGNEAGYEILRTGPNNPDAYKIFKLSLNSTSYTDLGLVTNAKYTYQIRAFNVYGNSAYSNAADIYTPNVGVPAAPTNLKSTNFTEKSITIEWADNSSNEEGFVIQRSLATDPGSAVSINVSANQTSLNDENLESNSTYVYTVKALNASGTSAASNKNVAATLSRAESKRVRDGLVAYYNFNYVPDQMLPDLSGYEDPLYLKIERPEVVTWNNYNRLELPSSNALVSTLSASKIVTAVKRTGAITVECWVRPSEPSNSSDARILTLGLNDSKLGLAIDQHYTLMNETKSIRYGVRMQTMSTEESGNPEIEPDNSLSYLNLQHVAYTRDSIGNEVLYVNGKKVSSGYRPGELNAWREDYYLTIGNSSDRNHPFKGTFYTVAVYNKPLSPLEINRNFVVGPCDSLNNAGKEFKVDLYPNPVSQLATLNITPLSVEDYLPQTTYRVVDMFGKTYINEVIFNPNNIYNSTLDFSGFEPGMYFLQVLSGTSQKTTKIIVQ
jgi:fibronectin type 3 domain-containing protein